MRNTDQDWIDIAVSEPYFGVLAHSDFLKNNINAAALNRFWQSGRDDIRWQVDLLRAHYGPFEPKVALDFGCGVGRLTRSMADIAETVFGVDVAPAMLEIARQGAPANAHFVELIPDQKLDWINSLIVFQHIPPTRGMEILTLLLDRLNAGGGLTLHFTIYKELGALSMKGAGVELFRWDGGSFHTLASQPPERGGMTMFDYDLNQVMALLHRAGVHRTTLQYTNHGGHIGVIVFARKG